MAVSSRRFDVDSSLQPIVQLIVSTIPFFVLLLWFLISAHNRPNANCYVSQEDVNDDATASALDDECSQYVPLKQFVWVFLSLELLWALFAGYLSFYIPRRHSLVREFLTQGEVVIGDVYYNRKKRSLFGLSAYGNIVYRHPDDATTLLKRKVRVFERYTRERAAVIVLPGFPSSGQPKLDLEIDMEVVEMNQRRRKILTWYAWAWVVFCMVAPVYIVWIMQKLDGNNLSPWQPDIDLGNFPTLFYVLAFVAIPLVAAVWIIVAWFIHSRWMKHQHKTLEEGEPVNEPEFGACCFDDDECESIEVPTYQPPQANAMARSEKGASRVV